MCGIAGIVALRDGARPPGRDELVRMAGAIHHRGPDEFGVYRDARAGLAHARLSIIDLTTGQQPLSNESGDLWVVFNGEIFNYVELREELLSHGHRFRTQSDTEVIVHAYEQWGDAAFARFNGQFAIGLYSSASKTLVLARDRLGVRPLHICEHDGRLLFASEVKAIFAGDRTVPRRLDPIGLDETFTFWTVVAPRTMFEGISELPPGHVRTFEPTGAVRSSAFWAPHYKAAFKGTLEDATAAVGEALDKATSLRMLRTDVSVGSYLSGGLDSSLVAALGRRAKGDRFCTFSIRFDDAEYDETRFQRAMVERLGSEHREVIVTRTDIAAVFPDVVRHTERPLLRTAPAPLFLLSKLVQEAGIKVVLTGEGADEMFAGYDLFREAKVRRFWARRPGSTLRPRLLERLYPYLARSPVAQRAMSKQFFGRNLERWREPGFGHGVRWQSTAALKRLFSAELRGIMRGRDAEKELLSTTPSGFESWSALAQDQYLEIRTLLSGYILSSQGDRMLMSHSVEGRFPFLDANVVELANSLPDSYKLRVLDEKHVVKRVGKGLIPAEIVQRKKQPYRAPDALCFVGPRAPAWVDEMLSGRALAGTGMFDPAAVSQLWNKCRTRSDEAQFSNADNIALVGILSTQLLHHAFVRTSPEPRAIELKTLIERTDP